MARNKVHPKLVERWAAIYYDKYRKDQKEAQAWYARLPDEYKPVLMAHLRRNR